MRINRYNRSFIGLMEMCYDGKWCKWNEVEEVLEVITEMENRIFEINTRLDLEKYNPKVVILKTYFKIIFVISIICNLILAAKLDGVF
jgi:pentatricopeptide repeat protein